MQEQDALVKSVRTTGMSGAYNFNVEVASPDTGCEQYADWWEVLTPDEALIYRRVLLHSHVSEQPFTRQGGPVAIETDQEVIVRVHMNNSGYSSKAMQGSIREGFKVVTLPLGFGLDVEDEEPQPPICTN